MRSWFSWLIVALLCQASVSAFAVREFVFRSEGGGRTNTESHGFVSDQALRIEYEKHRIFFDRPKAKIVIWEEGKPKAMSMDKAGLKQVSGILKSFGGMMRGRAEASPNKNLTLVSKGNKTIAGVPCSLKAVKESNDEVCIATWSALGLSSNETRTLREFFALFSELPTQMIPGTSSGNLVDLASQGKTGVPIHFKKARTGGKSELKSLKSVSKSSSFFHVPSSVKVENGLAGMGQMLQRSSGR